MIFGFVIGIIVAHLFVFLNIDKTIISGVRDMIKVDIGQSGYYLMFGVVGGVSRTMIGGFVSGLLVAYLFTFVNIDHLIIEGVKEWFKYDMGRGVYYLLFAILGAAVSFLEVVRMLLSPLFFMVKRKG
ncbi:MAG: hypothetical protein K0R78_1047 [Pelosinus sp.]|jgi:hypothetical protein|nr:hypothetical protein [Pelosinus sp.]